MRRGVVASLMLGLLLAACGGGSERTVLVFAAASLTDAFADLETAFEAEHPDLDVQLNLAGSSALREQILEGAPADVFAAADERIMAEVVAAELTAAAPEVFAVNALALVVPAGNPGSVTGLDAVADESLLVGVCAPAVPCGRFAAELFDRAGITPMPDTTEPDVRALLTKVAEDELDVGVVYVTDAVAAGRDVERIDIAADVNVEARYPIAALTDSEGAADFVAFVQSDEGRAILADHGFGLP